MFSNKRQKKYRFQRKGGEKDLRGVEEGKTVIRIFYMGKNLFSLKKEKEEIKSMFSQIVCTSLLLISNCLYNML